MTYNYQEWVNNPIKIFCKCGCGQEIIIKENHKYYGIPEYIRGHNPCSEETKQKLSKAHKGENNHNFGKIGENNPNFGKHRSEESKQKMSEAQKGKHHSKETKEKMSEAKKGEKAPNWKGGITNHPYCEKWTPKLREEIRNKYNRKCYNCGKDEKDNKYRSGKQCKLSVHHVDNDKQQGCDGKKWKLVPLCLHCHIKLHWNKIKLE